MFQILDDELEYASYPSMSEEQPILGLDVVGCSGCSGESSSVPSPESLPVMAEIHLVHAGQCAVCRGCCQPLIGYMVPGGTFSEQQSLLLEGSCPRTSRGPPSSDSSQDGESGLSGGCSGSRSSQQI